VRIFNSINIGMATALGEEGLIVPVIKHAENLSLLGMPAWLTTYLFAPVPINFNPMK